MPQDSLETPINDAIEPYKYQPLAQGCIRLIRLLPGNNDDTIQCEILSYTIRPGRISGPFDALSYVWGDIQQPGSIHIRSIQQDTTSSLLVTKNLHAALTQIRDSEIPKTLWIDAICINQGDLQERASQVRMMAQIYSHAARVIVWLGQTAEDSEAVFDVLFLFAQRSLRGKFYGNPNLIQIAGHKIHPLRALLRRAWFNRIWVLQEVAAARCVSIACGTSELADSDFLRGLRVWFKASAINDPGLLKQVRSVLHLMDKETTGGWTDFAYHVAKSTGPEDKSQESEDEEPFFEARRIERASRVRVELERSTALRIAPLCELLGRFHAHAATDRRDKVYALLGLCTNEMDHPSLQVDYNKDWATLLEELTQYFLGSIVSIKTWEKEEVALIRGRGCPLGSLTESDHNWVLHGPSFNGIRTRKFYWSFDGFLSNFVDDIRTGDILCLFQGAEYPSLIRRCGEYFVVVKIAVPEYPRISILEENSKRSGYMSWSEFLSCASKVSRDLLLIWDWSPEVKWRTKHHHELMELYSTEAPLNEKWNRYFNMLRILEDLQETEVLRDMLSSLPIQRSEIPSSIVRYFDMLRYMCTHWDSYMSLKSYVSQLRWSLWALNSSDFFHPVTGFWKSEGPLDYDLYEILSMTTTYDRSKISVLTEIENEPWDFGEGAIQPLLKSISPSFAQVASKNAASSSRHLGRRYMTHVVFSQAEISKLNPRPLLELLHGDSQLLEATRFSLVSLAEVRGVTLEMTSHILFRGTSVYRPMDWDMMSFLLETTFHDPSSIINIFEEARKYSLHGRTEHFETYSRFLIPRAAIICNCILTTELCDALVEHWESLSVGQFSVLEFLCDMYTSPFKAAIDAQDDCIAVSNDFPRTQKARADLVRSCLAASIYAIAPWLDTAPSSGKDGYPVHVLASLKMLWASKPSSDDLASTTGRLAIDA